MQKVEIGCLEASLAKARLDLELKADKAKQEKEEVANKLTSMKHVNVKLRDLGPCSWSFLLIIPTLLRRLTLE